MSAHVLFSLTCLEGMMVDVFDVFMLLVVVPALATLGYLAGRGD